MEVTSQGREASSPVITFSMIIQPNVVRSTKQVKKYHSIIPVAAVLKSKQDTANIKVSLGYNLLHVDPCLLVNFINP